MDLGMENQLNRLLTQRQKEALSKLGDVLSTLSNLCDKDEQFAEIINESGIFGKDLIESVHHIIELTDEA